MTTLLYLTIVAPFALAYGSLLPRFVDLTNSYLILYLCIALVHTVLITIFRRAVGRAPDGLRPLLTLGQHIPALLAVLFSIQESPPIKDSLLVLVTNGHQPDSLLGGVHLLPLVALLLEVALMVTTPCASKVGRTLGTIAAIILGTAFYSAPAHLFLFWIPALTIADYINLRLVQRSRRQLTPTTTDLTSQTGADQRLVFGSAIVAITSLLCVFGPSMLYASDPHAYFHEGVLYVLRNSSPLMGLIILSTFSVWTITP